MKVRLFKWGNSLAVRLPKARVDEMGLKAGDRLTVAAATDSAIALATNAQRLAQLGGSEPALAQIPRRR